MSAKMSVNPPRVLHIVEATTAGVRRYVTALAVGLRARGVKVAVAAPCQRRENYGDTAFVEDLRRKDVPFYSVPMQRRIGPWDAAAFVALCRLCREGHFTLVHTHSSKAGFLGRMAARVCNTPVIHTPNGLYFLEKTGVSRQFYLNLERLAGHLTTVMIAVSGDEKDVLVRNDIVAPARIRVIHNGVDVARIDRAAGLTRAEAKSRLGIHPDQCVVGAVGRLVPQKAPLAFVQVARRVTGKAPETQFVWVGSGPLWTEVEAQAKIEGVPLRLLGHREDVWEVMRAFDVFVLPSLYEGLPFVLLEALALALPVAVTDVVGIRDVVDDQVSGLVVPANAPAAMADAILSLLRDSQQARRWAAAGRQRVVAEFSLERMLDLHQGLYEELCAKPSQAQY
jgi:glycosyltransferase involved in cell wall biosynthesis